jgi:glucokinase
MADIAVATTTHHLLLAGDIGGTNTRLALYDRKQSIVTPEHRGGRYSRPLFAKEYLNEECLEYKAGGNSSENESENENVRNFVRAIIGPFLEEAWESKNVISRTDVKSDSWDAVVIVCCLGVAGPVDPSVDNGTVTTSQREYLKGLNGRGIAEHCQKMATANRDQGRAKALLLSCVKACVVINDFVAQGYGCLSLSIDSGELKRLESSKTDNKAAIVSNGPKVCVGAGTGFGSCYMVPTTAVAESEYLCFPSEYGQSDWAPNIAIATDDDDQKRLWKHLSHHHHHHQINNVGTGGRHVSVEDVVSGTGLATAYECLWSLFPEKANARVRAKFESERDLRGRVVGEHTADCELCKRAVDTVVRYVE